MSPEMRFVIGPIPKSETFDARVAGWTPLPSKSAREFALTAFLLALPLIAVAVVVFLASRAEVKVAFRASPLLAATFITGMLALVPIHEFVHALAYFKSPLSRYLIVGAWPQHGMFYALYDGPLPRARVLLMVAAPFLLLTAAPLFMIALGVLTPPPAVRAMLLFAALNHAALCVGDSIVLWRIMRNVPRSALIHNDGWITYWARSRPE